MQLITTQPTTRYKQPGETARDTLPKGFVFTAGGTSSGYVQMSDGAFQGEWVLQAHTTEVVVSPTDPSTPPTDGEIPFSYQFTLGGYTAVIDDVTNGVVKGRFIPNANG